LGSDHPSEFVDKKTNILGENKQTEMVVAQEFNMKSAARPPKQDCKAIETKSSVSRNKKRRKVARRRKEPSGVGKV
jgi:hypothetical protein